jgi:ATP-binding cassette subfamily C (CFTR/MRP) protein 1
MITKNLTNCTVLTIAHRLNTILESNKRLVLADGQLAKFDAPLKRFTLVVVIALQI